MTAQLSNWRRSIIFLGSAHDNGGTSILASNLANAMRARGHHVEEWYLFGSDGDLPAGARVFGPARRSRSPFVLIALVFRVVAALRLCNRPAPQNLATWQETREEPPISGVSAEPGDVSEAESIACRPPQVMLTSVAFGKGSTPSQAYRESADI